MDCKFFSSEVNLVLIIVVLLNINVNVAVYLNHCARTNELCDLHRQQPCCDSHEKCRPINSTNFCIRPVLIGRVCVNNSDCLDIEFSECVNEVCNCISNTIVVKGTNCQPLLNLSCREDEDCRVKNSQCINDQCQCKPSYVQEGYTCVTKILFESCRDDLECRKIQFSECVNDVCQCKFNYVAANISSCQPRLGGYCSKDYPCIIKNSECIDSECRCMRFYFNASHSECFPGKLGSPCNSASDCDFRTNLRCSNKICICKDNFAVVDGACVPISGGFCSNDSQCVFIGFECVANRCQCQANRTQISSHQCAETAYVVSCIDATECSDPWHAQCIGHYCVCTPHHLAIGYTTCYPILGGLCWNEHQCLTNNSKCIDFHCQCKKNFVAVSDNVCIPQEIYL